MTVTSAMKSLTATVNARLDSIIFDGTWKDHKVDGFMYGIFDKKWENGGQFAGKSYGYAVDIVMEHQ
mgnify:CR=1 FL=1